MKISEFSCQERSSPYFTVNFIKIIFNELVPVLKNTIQTHLPIHTLTLPPRWSLVDHLSVSTLHLRYRNIVILDLRQSPFLFDGLPPLQQFQYPRVFVQRMGVRSLQRHFDLLVNLFLPRTESRFRNILDHRFRLFNPYRCFSKLIAHLRYFRQTQFLLQYLIIPSFHMMSQRLHPTLYKIIIRLLYLPETTSQETPSSGLEIEMSR